MRAIPQHLPVLLSLVVLCLCADIVVLSVRAVDDFRAYRDVGYPDSATMLQVIAFSRTGILYPDLHRPPYQLTSYGPLGYVALSIPYRLAANASYSPAKVLRLAAFGSFLAAVTMVFLLTLRLTTSTWTAMLATLFAASAPIMSLWTMQIRFDYLGIVFGLLGVWVLLGGESTTRLAVAAICVALALLCKSTFVPMPLAVLCWLLYQRRFARATLWVIGVGLAITAGYGYFVLREPLAWQHFVAQAYSHSRTHEYIGALIVIFWIVTKANTLFFCCGAYLVWLDQNDNARLVIFYSVLAFLTGVLTVPYVGSGQNYFLEFWMLAAVLAAPGLLHVSRELRRTPVVVVALVTILLFYFLWPSFTTDASALGSAYLTRRDYRQQQMQWEAFHSVLAERRFFSFVPEVTIWSHVPEVPDVYLNSVLEHTGRWDSAPIIRNIESGSYETIVGMVDGENREHRGLKLLPSVYMAVKRHYARFCTIDGLEVRLPIGMTSDLGSRLLDAGCARVPQGR